MRYPYEKYRYYHTTTKDGRPKTIAVTTYAGKTVRGVSVCAPGDVPDPKIGERLAALACAEKVALKRLARASRKVDEADEMAMRASQHYNKMCNYYEDAQFELTEVRREYNAFCATLGE